MSWLNTLLDVGIIGMQVNQARKLDNLQQHHAGAAAIQAIVEALRSEIFNYNQAAQEILANEATDPLRTAGAMLVLQLRLDSLGLTAEMFPDLGDKEYVANTNRLIHSNTERLLNQLPPDGREEVEQMAGAAMSLPGYQYYLENYQMVHAYREALPVYKQLATRNGCLPVLAGLTLFGILLVTVPSLCGSIGSAISGSAGVLGAIVGFGIVLAIVVFALSKSSTFMRQKEYREAKLAVDKYKNSDIDMDYYNELGVRFGNNYQVVLGNQQKAQALVQNFFRDSAFSALLSIEAPAEPVFESKSKQTARAMGGETSSVTCPNGHQLQKLSRFCHVCGAPIDQGTVSA